ncbi:DUF1015 domain-containing protein [Anaerosporobacter faecicola]|uniref:DUF1015 domain-containing protein n=1 Tax=Anaerosporobacter faecicola TaxID=2718714 RepID=UPI00143B285F|nr:DUF1015 family protein [Anaerosporobacter faecicola]
MAKIKPFRCIRPNETVVSKVAALPYDVYNREEAKVEVEKEPLSFLKIDRAETQFDETVDTYDAKVYARAKETLQAMIANGTFVTDSEECYYLYELIMNGRAQTGIVACASIDDYMNQVIKKHENTREDKEIDRINHVDICNAQTGPIFLAYRAVAALNQVVDRVKQEDKLYGFTSEDGITHNVWKVMKAKDNTTIKECFENMEQIYIADGHHRCASAVKVGLKRRKENPHYTGEEEFNYFLSVLFPDEQLMIMDYNRAVKDLNGHSKEEFLAAIEQHFSVTLLGEKEYRPDRKGTVGMYLDKQWYKLEAKEDIQAITDPVDGLDVSILQDYLLAPVLGIEDPRMDKRIEFIGGIRGLGELERRVNTDMKVAFAMYPTSIQELFAVADANRLMPPKSTWFEPKLRSGIFIHQL